MRMNIFTLPETYLCHMYCQDIHSHPYLFLQVFLTHNTLFLHRDPTKPRIHMGVIASGHSVVCNDQMRQDFASQLGVLAYDQEFDAVVESIYGNRKDHYMFIRGISDYQ